MSGVNKQVPLEDAITEAKWMLGISETTIHDIDLAILAERCLIGLGNLNSTHIVNDTIDVIDGQAELPNNMIRLMAMRYCDLNGNSYGAYIGDFAFLDECSCSLENNSESFNLGAIVMIEDGKLQWKYPDNAPAKVRIAYRSRKSDKEGFTLIYDYMVECVSLYICSKFALKYIERYPQYNEWRKQYKAQHDRVVSLDTFNSFQNNFERIVRASHPVIITL